MKLDALLFDLDGTLVDTNGLHVEAWFEAFQVRNFQVERRRIAEEIGKGGDQVVGAILGEEVERDLGETIRERRGAAFARRVDAVEIEWLNGAREVLAACRARGLPTALATSAGAEDLERLERALGCSFRSLVNVVVTADAAPRGKPCPDLVLAACRDLGAHPSTCALVGDSTHDAVAARRAGVAFVGVATGFATRPRLLAEGAILVVDDLTGLLQGLDAAPRAPGRGETEAADRP
jgi:HAD superfamily hydrolase (TIGR01509 family)